MNGENSPWSLGSGAETWSRYDTYSTHKAKWDRIWEDLLHCQINKEGGPLKCWMLEPANCRDHPSIKSSVDYQQDGRPRMRAVVPNPGGSPRQKNIRLPLFSYSYFRANPNFRPLSNNEDEAGNKYEYSHLCHFGKCINPAHCTYETKCANQSRDWCDAAICNGRHNPPCLTSARDKQEVHDVMRVHRTTLRTDPWKRGPLLAVSTNTSARGSKRKEPPTKQQSLTKYFVISPNN